MSHTHCPRCDDVVRVIAPWAGYRALYLAWGTVVALLVLLLPFYFVDVCISVPAAMGVALAGGPLRRLAGQRMVCSVCSLEIERPSHGGTAIRVRPHVRRAG